jgi:hypothetical protein
MRCGRGRGAGRRFQGGVKDSCDGDECSYQSYAEGLACVYDLLLPLLNLKGLEVLPIGRVEVVLDAGPKRHLGWRGLYLLVAKEGTKSWHFV